MSLKERGIVISENNKAAAEFERLIPDFLSLSYSSPSEYVKICWDRHNSNFTKNKDLNGKIFEYIIATLCIREDILPLYLNAKIAFVPNVVYDLMLYTAERGPICLSIKTSLRERHKQADLESIALKYVHRRARSYLITLHEAEAKSVKAKIKTGDVIGLDNVIVATDKEFDDLVVELKGFKLELAQTVEIISSNQIIHKRSKT